MIFKNCKHCGVEFRAREWKNRPGMFCSQVCQRKGRQMREVKTITFECESCKKECTQPLYWKCPHKFCSIQCMAKERGKSMGGINHPNWKGGISKRPWSYTKIIREIKKTKTHCEKCGNEGKLEAHHKIKTSERPDLLEDLDNIEFICSKCHANEHPEFEGMILRKKSGIYKICECCKKEFYITKNLKDSIFCSKQCVLKIQKTGVFRNCDTCQKEYYVQRKNEFKSKYCCNKCRYIGTWKIRKQKKSDGVLNV